MEPDYSTLAAVVDEDKHDAAAIVLPGPPIEIFAQRGAPTAVLKPLQQHEHGKCYYECKTATGEYMQVGWADEEFKSIPQEGKGCGDDFHSWAYHGKRALKWHGNQKQKYGRFWKPGDVIGIGVDMERKEIVFSHNGDFGGDMGLAFENMVVKGAIYPCLTLARGGRIQIHLGYRSDPFHYQPPVGFKMLTVTSPPDVSNQTYSKFSSFAKVVKIGMSELSFTTSFPGEIMVNVMGRGLAYEAKKNAMMHGGYQETLEKWQKIKDSVGPSANRIGLLQDEIYALICYTLEKPPVYRFFNNETRIGYEGGGMDYPIITYLLREACRKLLAATSKEERTQTVYRGTSIPFSAEIGQFVRFGSYTSTTGNPEVAEQFQRSCEGTRFVIVTKIGASIKMFSVYPEEEEVLLPPSEIYPVNRIETSPSTLYLASIFEDDFVDKYVVNSNVVHGAERTIKNQ